MTHLYAVLPRYSANKRELQGDGMVVIVNGTNITELISCRGLSFLYSDVDSPNAGRTMDAVMHRGKIAEKIRLDITCIPMRKEEARVLFNLIRPEYVTVEFDDIQDGMVTKTMYSNNKKVNYLLRRKSGEELVDGVTFPLIEQ